MKYQWELSESLNHNWCKAEGFDAYGYPQEFFKLDMERIGIVGKRKKAKVIRMEEYRQGEVRIYIKVQMCYRRVKDRS